MALTGNIGLGFVAIRNKINLMTPRLIPIGGGSGQVLAKASAASNDVTWITPASVDYAQVKTMVQQALAEGSGSAPTPTPTPTPGNPVYPTGMKATRWTANGLGFPIVPTGQNGLGTGIVVNRGGTQVTAGADNRVVLYQGGYLATPALGWNFATSSDATKTRSVAKFRASFKGFVPNPSNQTQLLNIMEYGQAQFTLAAHWSLNSLLFIYDRGSQSQTIQSDAGDIKLNTLTLYEVEWVDNPATAGGTVTFYINGVQLGASKATTRKPSLTPNMVLNVNASISNTGPSVDGLQVEYVQIAYTEQP